MNRALAGVPRPRSTSIRARVGEAAPRGALVVCCLLLTGFANSILDAGTPPPQDREPPPTAVPPVPPPGSPLATTVKVVQDDSTAGVDAETIRLLDDLERSAEDLRQFVAAIVYERFHALTDGVELQFGTVAYERRSSGESPEASKPGQSGAGEAAPRPDGLGTRLGVFFDEYVDSSGRSERVEQRYVFAEGWLVEVDPGRRQFIKRQIVPPGQKFDPLKLGEGPFPLPIGQKRSEVLARFKAGPAPPPTASLLDRIDEGAIRSGSIRTLRLVPRSGTTEAEEFQSVDLYYETETLLPVGVVAVAPSGDRKIVRLTKIRRNEPLPEEVLPKLGVEAPVDTAGWTIDVRPWRS